jgi:hypothetical protein
MAYLESDLQIEVADYIRLFDRQREITWFSIPNELFGALRSKAGLGRMVRFKRMGLRSGVSDIVLIYRSRAYCLELKIKGGKQSENQEDFEKDARTSGAEYAIAFSLNEAIEILQGWGITPRS